MRAKVKDDYIEKTNAFEQRYYYFFWRFVSTVFVSMLIREEKLIIFSTSTNRSKFVQQTEGPKCTSALLNKLCWRKMWYAQCETLWPFHFHTINIHSANVHIFSPFASFSVSFRLLAHILLSVARKIQTSRVRKPLCYYKTVNKLNNQQAQQEKKSNLKTNCMLISSNPFHLLGGTFEFASTWFTIEHLYS